MRRDQAYRGYMIHETITGEFYVDKHGFLICWVSGEAEGRAAIDELLDGGFKDKNVGKQGDAAKAAGKV